MKKSLVIGLFFSIFATAQSEKATVYFDFDVYELNASGLQKLDEITLGRDIEVSRIYGFCDWKGSNAYNDSLSLKRVNSVFEYLKSKGAKIKSDYEKKGFGEDFDQSEVQSENRKVLVVFDENKKPEPVADNPDEPFSKTVKTSKAGDRIKLKNINFHNNSAVIVPKSKPILYDLLCALEDNPKLKIEIQGHICCQRKADVNDVSTARARAIYNFLIRNKIDRKRLAFKGFGISKPIHPIPEKSAAEEEENRRVEIMIVEN